MSIDDGFLDDDRLDNISLDEENDSQFKFRQYKKYISTIVISALLLTIGVMYFSDDKPAKQPTKPIEVGEKLDQIDTSDKIDETTIDDDLFMKDKTDDLATQDDKTSTNDIADNSALPTKPKPKGVFIQVGAYTTYPAKKVSNDIEKRGYKVVVFKKNVNGIDYFKVLIGPYATEQKARDDIASVKAKLGLKGVFIFK
jgi:cell division septation protein DedD